MGARSGDLSRYQTLARLVYTEATKARRGTSVLGFLKGLRITLYEVFGYILPGSVFLIALATLYWALYEPTNIVSFSVPGTGILITSLLISYMLGLVLQGLGNFMEKIIRPESRMFVVGKEGWIPKEIINTVEVRIKPYLNSDVKLSDYRWLYRLCDEIVLSYGVDEEREVFQYREGCYRGLALGFLFLAIALFLRAIVHGSVIEIWGQSISIFFSRWLFFIILTLVASVVSIFRYQRFAKYRVAKTFLAFLSRHPEDARKKPEV